MSFVMQTNDSYPDPPGSAEAVPASSKSFDAKCLFSKQEFSKFRARFS